MKKTMKTGVGVFLLAITVFVAYPLLALGCGVVLNRLASTYGIDWLLGPETAPGQILRPIAVSAVITVPYVGVIVWMIYDKFMPELLRKRKRDVAQDRKTLR